MAFVLEDSVRTIRVGRLGSARVWLGVCPDAAYGSAGVQGRRVASGPELPMLTTTGIEALIPRGPFSEYGLLGLSGRHQKDQHELRLEVPWTEAEGAPWPAALVGATPSPRVGLPQEFADAVLDGLDAASRARLAGGILAVRAAAHSPVGSSPNLMARLARACVGLMLRGDMRDDELSIFLEDSLLS